MPQKPPIYDKLARFYDLAFAPLETRWLGRLRREVLALLPLDAAVLEIGAGTGANFEYYPPTSLSVGIEISGAMLKKAAGRDSSVSLVQADAQQLPFSAHSFDAAIATLVFCSVPDPIKGFNEIQRVVRPGGRVVLLEHVRPDGVLGVLFDALNSVTSRLIDDHFNRRTAQTAADAGLVILDIRGSLGGAVQLIICEIAAADGSR